MNFIKKAVLSIFLINSIIYGADPQEQKQIWKTLQFPTIKTVEGQGQIKHRERVNLNTVDSITKKTLKRLIAEQWRKQLPWVLAATLEVDDDGALWRNYFDAHAINQWLLNDRFQRNAGRVNPATGRPIITLDYFSINHADKEFKHLGTLAQLIKNDPPKVRLFLQASEGDNLAAINDLAFLLEQQGQTDEAETLYRIAVNLTHEDDSNYPIIISNLAHLLKNQDKIDEAKTLYKIAVEKGNRSAIDLFRN
jgi:tetratricopeptide (TPR) repeat protein